MSRPRRKQLVKCLTNRAEVVLGGKGGIVIISLEDVARVRELAWSSHGLGYARAKGIDGKKILLHRYILGASSDAHIDHINRNPSDNRRCNLRIATRSQNMQNRTSANGGITRRSDNGKWRARITVNGQKIALGQYDTQEEALRARREAELKYFGEFAPAGAA